MKATLRLEDLSKVVALMMEAAVPNGLSRKVSFLRWESLQDVASVFPGKACSFHTREETRRPQCLLPPSLRSHSCDFCVESTRSLSSQISTRENRSVQQAGLSLQRKRYITCFPPEGWEWM